MVKKKEEKPPGVPAYMATFADLMTLLLVFFILLNVYAKEKQYGLLSAASGSFEAAILDTLGMGGLLSVSREPVELAAAKHRHHQSDPKDSPASPVERKGDELDVGSAGVEELDGVDSLDLVAPFVFPHGKSDMPKKGADWLGRLARDLSSGRFTIVISTRAAFLETLTPMELACERGARLLEWMRDLGIRATLEVRARVVIPEVNDRAAKRHRQVAIRIIRKT